MNKRDDHDKDVETPQSTDIEQCRRDFVKGSGIGRKGRNRGNNGASGCRRPPLLPERGFEQALEDARSQGSEGYVVKDLRAFNVVFA
jgi:hypothetical protein